VAAIYLPPWRIDVTRHSGVAAPLPARALARTAARALTAAGAPAPASLALILSDDEELAALNLEHMGHPGPTDVLSFPMLPPSAFAAHPGQDPMSRAGGAADFPLPPRHRRHLGDVIVSVERAVAQAPSAPADELRQLVVHGVLHVCGWDHADRRERDAMRALERAVLATP